MHQNRSAIEGLFSAIVSPTIWSQTCLNHLQEELFKTERGLELLIEAATQISSHLDEIPADIMHPLIEGLLTLENQLWEMASGEAQAQLTEIGATLQAQLKTSLEHKPQGEWSFSLLRIGVAARQLARSIVDLRTIETVWKEGLTDETARRSLSTHSPSGSPGSQVLILT